MDYEIVLRHGFLSSTFDFKDPYTFTKEDIVKGLQQVDQVEESPIGIVSLKPLSYWELKVLDLKEEVKNLT